MERIVVGVDGSPASREALSWALAHAGDRATDLLVVHVYGPGRDPNPFRGSIAGSPDSKTATRLTASESRWREDQQRAAKQQAERVVRSVVDAVDGASTTNVRTDVLAGPRASQALIERSRDADLLVVGSRGRGGFKGLALGSVSQQVAQHAACPVVVVRPADTATG